ncbi:hypothetical protein K439DRAFT_605895 [Ramaria rubella]|nr:hypothetical protein K439DRAFT_605895 [Ramaria rubella]
MAKRRARGEFGVTNALSLCLKAQLKTLGIIEHTFALETGKENLKGIDWKTYNVGGARSQSVHQFGMGVCSGMPGCPISNMIRTPFYIATQSIESLGGYFNCTFTFCSSRVFYYSFQCLRSIHRFVHHEPSHNSLLYFEFDREFVTFVLGSYRVVWVVLSQPCVQ